jgi:hypothetical protein
MLNRVLTGARTDESEKVGFSMQMPKELKDRFDAYCKKNKVTMTAMLQSFMQYTVNVDDGIEKGEGTDMPFEYKKTIINVLERSANTARSEYEEIMMGNINVPEEHAEGLKDYAQHCTMIQKYIMGDKK